MHEWIIDLKRESMVSGETSFMEQSEADLICSLTQKILSFDSKQFCIFKISVFMSQIIATVECLTTQHLTFSFP